MTGFAAFLGGVQADPDEAKTLEQVFAPALRPDKAPEPFDGDERGANLMARRYAPGQLSSLSQRLAEEQAQLAALQEANDAAVKRQARAQRDHQNGKISVFDIMRMDLAEPDLDGEARLQRRVDGLRRQLEDISAVISPRREGSGDPLEQAASRAHGAFLEATRAALEAAPAAPGPRPFAGPGDAGDAPDCPGCAEAGASRAESAQIHAGAYR
jgi:hypothetical protein